MTGITTLAVHTDAPILPLTKMVGDTANIEIGRAAGTHDPDCFGGWAEAQIGPDCKPHNILWGMDNTEAVWVAGTLAGLGYQVVVTLPDTDDQFGDHHVVDGAPQHYTMDHSH